MEKRDRSSFAAMLRQNERNLQARGKAEGGQSESKGIVLQQQRLPAPSLEFMQHNEMRSAFSSEVLRRLANVQGAQAHVARASYGIGRLQYKGARQNVRVGALQNYCPMQESMYGVRWLSVSLMGSQP